MILVIDNYDSFTYNLVHLVGKHGVPYKVVRNDSMTCDAVAQLAPAGILISPGPGRPRNAGVTLELISRLGASTPILGICLGHQAIASAHGATVTYAPTLMHGKTCRIRHDGQSIFAGVPQHFEATRYHSLVVARETIPKHLVVTANSEDGVVMGIRHRTHPIEGVQFHPESVLTTAGPNLVANWIQQVFS